MAINLWDARHLPSGPAVVIPGDTLPEMFWNAVAARGDKPWLREKKLGLWHSWSWNEVATAVREISAGMIARGLEQQHRVSILSNTRLEWVLADLAVLCSAAVSSGIYPTDAPSQVLYLCQDSDSRIVFVENDEQLDKVLQVQSQLPQLHTIVVFDNKGLEFFKSDVVISLEQLRQLGRSYLEQHPDCVSRRSAACQSTDLAMLVYTSGTTGKPKGAMHSHKGTIASIRAHNVALASDENDERMAFLPLCHVAERLGGEFHGMHTGAKLNFVENPETVPENIREIAPTLGAAVPRVWEKFYSAAMIGLKEASLIQQVAYRWAIAVGYQVVEKVLADQPVTWHLKARFLCARFMALDNVRKMLGIHRARTLVTGAAPISPDLIRWYLALGLPMAEVWGMTETCSLSIGVPITKIKPGTIGLPYSVNEAKLDPVSNEILIRGPNVFMGYLNAPEKTAETIDAEGWLHTGDVGRIDADGYFSIVDRMKDIIITAGGKNITPSEWENQLKFSPYITDAVVIGDQRPYLVAIIMIDLENVEKYAQDHDVPFSNYASLTQAPEIQALIEGEMNRVNEHFARVEQVKKFWLLDTQLSAEDEELTATMKLKRKLVLSKYAEQIEKMYR